MTGDKQRIPRGCYCYELTGRMKTVEHVLDGNGQLKKVGPYQMPERKCCPYWSLPEGGNGYCAFLKKSDDDLGAGLLWDQVKECGENMDDDPGEEE